MSEHSLTYESGPDVGKGPPPPDLLQALHDADLVVAHNAMFEWAVSEIKVFGLAQRDIRFLAPRLTPSVLWCCLVRT